MDQQSIRAIPYASLAQHVGRSAVSDWHAITQERIDRFADATDDRQWIHVDVERAEREVGGTIAHGFLLLSLIPFLSRGLIDVSGVSRRINYGIEQRALPGAECARARRVRLTFRRWPASTARGAGTAAADRVHDRRSTARIKPACADKRIVLMIARMTSLLHGACGREK